MTGDGSITSTDVAVVKAGSGSAVPPAGPPSRIVDVVNLYDSAGRRDRIVAGTDYDFTYRYDEMGRLKRIFRTALPSAVYRYDYDVNSNVTARVDELRGTTLGFVPDELNRIKERVITLPGAAGGEVSHERYGYDAMSRLTTTNRDEDGLRDGFAYNDAGELTTARYGQQWNGTAWVNPNRSVDYVLDDAGNRDSVIEGGTHDYVANALNQYTTAADQPATHGSQHELSNHAGVNYHYLADTYLAEVISAVGTMRFGYDALGRRVKKTEGAQTPGESTTWFAYDGAHAIVEFSSDGTAIANTLYGQGADELIARNNYGTAQYFHQDRLGNVSMVTGGDGSILETYRYDAFGAPTIKSPNGATLSQSAINNRFLFTGREWVPQYGFYEYRARAYNPALGRFMSEDPMGFDAGDTNLYRYCGGDPVNKTDPTGLATYIGFKLIATGIPMSNSNPFIYPGAHWFVYTTGSSGALQNIYSWGSNGNPGYWENSPSTLAQNVRAAQSFISNGNSGARFAGNSSLDPFVAFAYSQLSRQPPHWNGALPGAWGQPSCEGEAKNLVAYAQFLLSRYLFRDNVTGAPVFSARAVSGFTADGRPIYVDTTPWESAGYADAASYAAARQESALQYANAQAVPTWDPFYQTDFNTIFAGHNPGHADGVGGAYISNGGR
ncbi:MAG: RHS repeat-associated core domain-containing protein [Chthoniobacterales bacterium]